MNLVAKSMESPVGRLRLVATEERLVAILWEHERAGRVVLDDALEDERHPLLVEAERQLREYFDGERQGFSIPLELRGTPFQRKVWQALLAIPFGGTRTYGQLAEQVGKPRAVRAVGSASGRNPLSIVVPCHRLVGANGKLTGYAGGLEAKARLLALEVRGG